MPTIKEANKKRKAYAWMISAIMAEKEHHARERLVEIDTEQSLLKPVYEEYLRLYDLHIKPLMPKVDTYLSNIHEKRKIEHFLQGQAEHLEKVMSDQQRAPSIGLPGQRSWTLPPQVERLPYADKSSVGKKPPRGGRVAVSGKLSDLKEDEAKEVIRQLKKLDPSTFADLLKQIGGK